MKNAKKTVVTSRFLPNVIITRDGGKPAQFFPYSLHLFMHLITLSMLKFMYLTVRKNQITSTTIKKLSSIPMAKAINP